MIARSIQIVCLFLLPLSLVAQEPIPEAEEERISEVIARGDVSELAALRDQWKLTARTRIGSRSYFEGIIRSSALHSATDQLALLNFALSLPEAGTLFEGDRAFEIRHQMIGAQTSWESVQLINESAAKKIPEIDARENCIITLAAALGNVELIKTALENGERFPEQPGLPYFATDPANAAQATYEILAPSPLTAALSGGDHRRYTGSIASLRVKGPDDPAILKRRQLAFIYGRHPFATRTFEREKTYESTREIVSLLLDAGAPVDHPDAFGRTPVFYAAWIGWPDLFNRFLKENADLTRLDLEGRGILHLAVDNTVGCDPQVLEDCLDFWGHDVDLPDDEGSTPLMIASYRGHLSAVKRLLEEGADPLRKDAKGGTAISRATTYQKAQPEILKALAAVAGVASGMEKGLGPATKSIPVLGEELTLPVVAEFLVGDERVPQFKVSRAQFKASAQEAPLDVVRAQIIPGRGLTSLPEAVLELDEIEILLQSHHDGWPLGASLELKVEDRYRNGTSASGESLAWAVGLSFLIGGEKTIPETLIRGGLDQGEIVPSPRIDEKLSAAFEAGAQRVVVPGSQLVSLGDLLLSRGLASFSKIEFLTAAEFSEVRTHCLAQKEGASPSAGKLALMEVQTLLSQEGGAQHLRHPKVIEKLEIAVAEIPQSGTAKVLLAAARGRVQFMSERGALAEVRRLSPAIQGLVLSGRFLASEERSGKVIPAEGTAAEAIEVVRSLTDLRPKLDGEGRTYGDLVLELAQFLKETRENPPRSDAVLEATQKRFLDLVVKINASAAILQTNDKM